jgi:amidase
MLETMGAVVYVKTNIPTAMMIAESVNNTFGRTLNPLNRQTTPGGSSGGESALIAFGGSCLGVGSDIGGSLRIPAACTGIYTLRPSFGRFPTLSTRSGLAGQEAIQSVNGPLCKSIEDMVVYSQAVIGAEPWLVDPRCLPLPWRSVSVGPKLKIGVMWNDGVVLPTPPVERALKEVVDKLKANGHEIIEWEPVGHLQGVTLLGELFVSDGGKSLKKLLAPVQEPFRPELISYETAKEAGVYE